jgi:hypothetical protein
MPGVIVSKGREALSSIALRAYEHTNRLVKSLLYRDPQWPTFGSVVHLTNAPAPTRKFLCAPTTARICH